jgi:hypothetical protein
MAWLAQASIKVPAKTLLYAVVALEPSHRICVIEDAVFIVPRGEYKEGERVRVTDGPYERFFGSLEAASAAARGAARGARVLEFQVGSGTAVVMTLCTDVHSRLLRRWSRCSWHWRAVQPTLRQFHRLATAAGNYQAASSCSTTARARCGWLTTTSALASPRCVAWLGGRAGEVTAVTHSDAPDGCLHADEAEVNCAKLLRVERGTSGVEQGACKLRTLAQTASRGPVL